MFDIKTAKIIGLGESSHGSATEFNLKTEIILNYIASNLDKKITIYFEAYSDTCSEIDEILRTSPKKIIKDF